MASTVTSRRKQLGNELRHARTAARMTQQQVAEVLGCTQGKVNKIESGAVGVKLGDVRSMLNAFGINGEEADTLMNLARAAAGQRGHWSGYRSVVPHWFRTFTDLEPAAAEILTWHGERIPGHRFTLLNALDQLCAHPLDLFRRSFVFADNGFR